MRESIVIREERVEDRRAVEEVMREAFWNYYSPKCSEHYLVHIMRDCAAFVPELALVACDGDNVVGAVMFLKGFIEGDDGARHEILGLGPIAVLPAYQREGIGGALIERAAEKALDEGFSAMILMGDPDVYSRKGFVAAQNFGIRTEADAYMPVLQVRELREGALDGAAGRYIEDAIYAVDEEACAEFDKQFPEKEPVSGTPSQKRFDYLCSLVIDPKSVEQ
ncbi:MAG: N-acetyltransferase [Slackia sp.]|nr:N-acetyltransferase [Slackia sp.]